MDKISLVTLNFDNHPGPPFLVAESLIGKVTEYEGDDRLPQTILLYLECFERPGVLTGSEIVTFKSWWKGDIEEASRLDVLLLYSP